ncbi:MULTISPECIES: ead/Ea22-like family protein [Klebsiella pneumoniae complex]|uniref:ead/Ea22-like family protein n=1 Tax=Klebsiella pneumoniae complex TaxID=3390273 RepID=UPI000808B21F|nr:RelE family toxin-antitoxin system [Klebsiella quasipneumoniae]SBY11326.1 RelE family toxin-antitoxin system [Klebsiella quasipneumoniae]SWR22312.1 RelE family toxin-antitoxin system [Klebsiella pneumoniae]SWR27791.1 RelE family toxin-antitoxin system [Klebsiella pneumoniae]
MTTNITALAQSLKAAAEGVIKNYDCEWFETGRQICTVHKSKINLISLANPANVLALVEALASEKRICATWRKTAEANSEKLEKAQQQMTESENRVRKQNRHICELFDDNTALRQRIAGLEARAVTAGNLQESAYRAGLTAGWNLGLANNNDGFNKCLAAHAAGIKVEAE